MSNNKTNKNYKGGAHQFTKLNTQGIYNDVKLLMSQNYDDLQFEYEDMMLYGNSSINGIQVINTMTDWPAKTSDEIGWTYN